MMSYFVTDRSNSSNDLTAYFVLCFKHHTRPFLSWSAACGCGKAFHILTSSKLGVAQSVQGY